MAGSAWVQGQEPRTRLKGRRDVRAVYGNWRHSLRIDKCRGEVDRLQRTGRSGGVVLVAGSACKFNFGS